MNDENGINQNVDSLPVNNESAGIPVPPSNNVEPVLSPVIEQPQMVEPVVEPMVQSEPIVESVVEPQIANETNVINTVNEVQNNTVVNNTPNVNNILTETINNASAMPTREENIEDYLVHAYVGPNDSVILYDGFNWAAFFLSFLYCFFRKMHLWGLLVLFLFSIPGAYIKSNFGLLFLAVYSIVYSILEGVIFNRLYAKKATRKVRKLIEKNPGMSKEELANKASRKGGRSLFHVLLGIAFLIITIFGIAFLNVIFKFSTISIKYNVPFSSFFNFNKDKTSIVEKNNNSDNSSTEKIYELNPSLIPIREKSDIEKLFVYEVPKQFTKKSDSIGALLTYESNGIGRTIKFYAVKYHEDPDILPKRIEKYYASYQSQYISSLGEVKGEDLTWYYISTEDKTNYVTKEYFTKYDGIVYWISYSYNKKQDPDVCKIDMNDFVKHIKIK